MILDDASPSIEAVHLSFSAFAVPYSEGQALCQTVDFGSFPAVHRVYPQALQTDNPDAHTLLVPSV